MDKVREKQKLESEQEPVSSTMEMRSPSFDFPTVQEAGDSTIVCSPPTLERTRKEPAPAEDFVTQKEAPPPVVMPTVPAPTPLQDIPTLDASKAFDVDGDLSFDKPIERISHFRVINKIGEGGMGAVYRAKDEYLDRLVALKVILNSNIDTESTQRLLREARAASRISHPNVVTVYAAGEVDGRAFIAMEYVEGKELTSLIKTDGIDTMRSLAIAAQIAEGLGAAHSHGIVHRDIKPANVLICPLGDRVKILDFGLAKPGGVITEDHPRAGNDSRILSSAEMSLNVYNTQMGVIWGSLHYMSPEQACGEPLDARSDIFSLGVVLYQMLTGRLPFYAKRPMDQLAAMMNEEPPPLRNIRLRIPDSVQAIVSKALSKNRDMRYADGNVIASELRTVCGRLQEFGDGEIEIVGNEAPSSTGFTRSPSPSGSLTTEQPAPAPQPVQPPAHAIPSASGIRYDKSFRNITLAYQPPGSEFDLVVHSPHLFEWPAREVGAYGDVLKHGATVSIHKTLFELVKVESPREGSYRFYFNPWPDIVIRRVIHFTPELVAAYEAASQQPKKGTGSFFSNLFGKKK